MDAPIYTISEAAHYLKIAPATLRSWVAGRNYPTQDGLQLFKPLITLNNNQGRLSFNNLIEAYILRSLRQDHSVAIKNMRLAIEYARKQFRISNLFLNKNLLTARGDLFLQVFNEVINLSKSGQIALKKAFEDHLQRIEWTRDVPSRLFPFINHDPDKIIAIDPKIKFGSPIISSKSISTSIIVDRIDAGESVLTVADDYGLDVNEIELAVRYENAA